eukprot:895155-Pelagomonas_calceolata.AAC.3
MELGQCKKCKPLEPFTKGFLMRRAPPEPHPGVPSMPNLPFPSNQQPLILRFSDNQGRGSPPPTTPSGFCLSVPTASFEAPHSYNSASA